MRKPRIKLPNERTAYHVMTRTCQQAYYLSEEVTPGFKKICQTIIEQMTSVYHVDLHAWAIMDNHFHLCITIKKPEKELQDIQERFELLQTYNARPSKWCSEMLDECYVRFTDLSWFMWDLNRRMARAYNQLHDTVGHFWGSRFKSIILEDDPAVLRVLAYIEQNPVKANMVNMPSNYVACSTSDNLVRAKSGMALITKPVGWMKRIPAQKFAWIYQAYMDWLALIRFGNEQPLMPAELEEYKLLFQDAIEMTKSLNNGDPVNWSKQGYGSQKFMTEIEKLESQALSRIG